MSVIVVRNAAFLILIMISMQCTTRSTEFTSSVLYILMYLLPLLPYEHTFSFSILI